jgi:hypothetical protein
VLRGSQLQRLHAFAISLVGAVPGLVTTANIYETNEYTHVSIILATSFGELEGSSLTADSNRSSKIDVIKGQIAGASPAQTASLEHWSAISALGFQNDRIGSST